jgi:hypothetical protein
MMWNPFKKRGGAEVHSLVVKNPGTGANEVHFIITVVDLADAGEAIAEAFESVVSGHRSDPDIGGEVVFVVRGPKPGTELPPELVEVQSRLEAKSAGLQAMGERPLRVRMEYKESAF